MHPGMPASDEDEELMVTTTGPKVAIPCKSIKVACKANKLWRANLKLHEHQLAMAEKQAARDKCLIGAVQALTAALSHTDLVVDLAQGRVVGGMGKGRSTGKGKGRADLESSVEESGDEDAVGRIAPCILHCSFYMILYYKNHTGMCTTEILEIEGRITLSSNKTSSFG